MKIKPKYIGYQFQYNFAIKKEARVHPISLDHDDKIMISWWQFITEIMQAPEKWVMWDELFYKCKLPNNEVTLINKSTGIQGCTNLWSGTFLTYLKNINNINNPYQQNRIKYICVKWCIIVSVTLDVLSGTVHHIGNRKFRDWHCCWISQLR